jgi:hypothetical protein
MRLRSWGGGHDEPGVRYQRPRNVEFDSSATTVCHGQCGRDGGAGCYRLEEFRAVNTLALEWDRAEQFKAMQALGQQ